MPIELNGRTLRQAIWGLDSYGLLFILLIGDYLVLSLVNSDRWGGLVRTVPVACTVLFALHTSASRRSALRFAQIAVVVSVAAGIAQAVQGKAATAAAISFFLVGFMLLLSPVAILRRVLPKETVEVESLFAAVDVYIIIGLIFSLLFIGISTLWHPPQHTAFLAQAPWQHPPSNYVYLSFVTLTTVGFGDLTPLSNVARSVVVLEALMGQIFLVTLVARLVALYSAQNRRGVVGRRRRTSAGPESPPSVDEAERAARVAAAERALEAARVDLAIARAEVEEAATDLGTDLGGSDGPEPSG